jgi:alkylation response protein AidB-like acyl-CoA dehydrogenase
MDTPGIEVQPVPTMASERTNATFYDEVRIGDEWRLGDVNGGWGVAMAVLQDERGGAGASGVISLRRRLEHMIQGAGEVNPLQIDGLIEILNRGKALQSLMERRGDDSRIAPIAKLMNSELGYDEAQLDASLRGAHSMLTSASIQALLYSPGMRIAGGSSEIQRNIISERVLGMPKEQRSDTGPFRDIKRNVT